MAKIKSLFAKKKEETDGQEEFFKEDFAPVAKKPATKKPAAKVEKATPKTAAKVEKDAPKAEKKAESKKSASKTEKPATKAANAKKADPKVAKSTPAKKAAAPAKKTEPKKAATKAEKPAAKAANAKKAAPKTKASKAQAQEINENSPVVKGAVAVKSGKEQADGKWEINRAKDGRYFFALYASNHTVIAYSQVYSSTTAVTTGINSVIANAAKAETEDTTLKKSVSLPCPKWEIYLDKAGEYRFRLYAPNGLIVCHASHGYATKGGCKGGIESIKRFASEEASVNKTYLK